MITMYNGSERGNGFSKNSKKILFSLYTPKTSVTPNLCREKLCALSWGLQVESLYVQAWGLDWVNHLNPLRWKFYPTGTTEGTEYTIVLKLARYQYASLLLLLRVYEERMCLYTDIKLKTKQLAKKKKKNPTDQFKTTQSLLVMLCTDTDGHNKLVKVKYKL